MYMYSVNYKVVAELQNPPVKYCFVDIHLNQISQQFDAKILEQRQSNIINLLKKYNNDNKILVTIVYT